MASPSSKQPMRPPFPVETLSLDRITDDTPLGAPPESAA